FGTFRLGEAVQYFYEPFLEAFDPELRKELGVWYTPKEIVQYQVARVDTVLREEMGIAAGLADPSVYVLDPCCGTGAYLVEVLRRIQDTLAAAGTDALVAGDIRKAARDRVFGFEILPGSFVVAHLQLGLLLNELGAPLTAEGDRAGIFLTNALTGWEGGDHDGPQPFPELAQERERADQVKQAKPILVVLGNPPYHAFAGVAEGEEAGLVDPYKDELSTRWGVRKYNLDDLYVRFFRIAERKIVDMTGRGVVSYISNYSYLTEASFVQMRERLMNGFDRMWFDNLNGDSRRTGKVAPDGSPDPSVFSTESNRAGIRVGTAVCVLARTRSEPTARHVKVRAFWGSTKKEQLLASAEAGAAHPYTDVTPTAESRYRFAPSSHSEAYAAWPTIDELAALAPQNGLLEKRGGSLIAIDADQLRTAMKAYFDPELDWRLYRTTHQALTKAAAGFDPQSARTRALQHERFDPNLMQPYAIRPFDRRTAYYTACNPIWNRPRPGLAPHVWKSNLQLIFRKERTASPEGICVSATTLLGDNDFFRGHGYYVPVQLRNQAHVEHEGLFSAPPESERIPNLSAKALQYLTAIGYVHDDPAEFARVIWEHTLAVAHSPAYNTENFDDLGRGFPRIPLPSGQDLLRSSASLGHQLALLLDTEHPVAAAARARLARDYAEVGTLSAPGGRALDAERGDLAVTAGWGIRGKGGVTMPGKGKVTERPDGALDIWLNDRAHWANVPPAVWDYTLGGYQVIKKWLSYREKALLGRDLTVEEARYVSEMIRRIAAILELGPTLDENYARVKANAFDWSSVAGTTPRTPA
ncbi:MAG TPA: type ISP restriction/modification enzyme, partial [Gemmatimonadales bacterium]|nr:type ISP restriction/modification enzyme [Gemmatimonadales bacterium]